MIIDAFAGPGGWDEALATLGRTDVLGIEWDKAACDVATAAGHARLWADVAALNPHDVQAAFGHVEGLIASPPCQAWSMAGNRKGELDRANCHALADRMAAGDDTLDWTEWEDQRSPLVCQPVRWVRELRPQWIALEEVPAVASLWQHFARIYRTWGYSVWTGDLCAADYGVPQTRTRRILMAHRAMVVQPPEPTHCEGGAQGDLFGGQLAPWMSMAEALGWGFDAEPAAAISGGGTESGGAEPFANMGYRRKLAAWVLRNGNQANACERTLDQPAGTLYFGERLNDVSWTHYDSRQSDCAPRPVNEPAPTMLAAGLSKGVGVWTDDPGDPSDSCAGYRPTKGVRVTVQEAGILQSFPADYPWHAAGSRTKAYGCVGNAIPPVLAAHILAALGAGQLPQAVAA